MARNRRTAMKKAEMHLDDWEVLEVVSQWEAFHEEFLNSIWTLSDTKGSGIGCLWDDSLKWWSRVDADLKEYFFMELFICCKTEMKEPEKAVEVVRATLPTHLRDLEKSTQREPKIDLGMYLGCLFGMRDDIWKMGREASENLPTSRWMADDPPNGRFRSWMQRPGLERCRGIYKDIHGNFVIAWSPLEYKRSRHRTDEDMTEPELQDMFDLAKWHENNRPTGTRNHRALAAPPVRPPRLVLKFKVPPLVSECAKASEHSLHKVRFGRVDKSRPLGTVTSASTKNMKELAGDDSPSLTNIMKWTLADKLRRVIQQSPNRRLKLDGILAAMKPLYQPKNGKYEDTIRQTLSKTTRDTKKFELIKYTEKGLGHWVCAEDLKWDAPREQATQRTSAVPDTWEDVTFASQTPLAAERRLKVKDQFMTLQEHLPLDREEKAKRNAKRTGGKPIIMDNKDLQLKPGVQSATKTRASGSRNRPSNLQASPLSDPLPGGLLPGSQYSGSPDEPSEPPTPVSDEEAKGSSANVGKTPKGVVLPPRIKRTKLPNGNGS